MEYTDTGRHATVKRKIRVIFSVVMIVLFLSSCANSCGASDPSGTSGAAGAAGQASGQASGQVSDQTADQAVSPDASGGRDDDETPGSPETAGPVSEDGEDGDSDQ